MSRRDPTHQALIAASCHQPSIRLVLPCLAAGQTSYEKGLGGHMTKRPGQEWQSDELIMDERYVAAKVKGGGLVVFSSCSHAGIINVCHDAIKAGGGARLFCVVGGFHLAGGPGVESRIEQTVQDLVALDPYLILPGHCTGWRAKAALLNAFGDRVQPTAVGSMFAFSAPAQPAAEVAAPVDSRDLKTPDRSLLTGRATAVLGEHVYIRQYIGPLVGALAVTMMAYIVAELRGYA